jgi:hypothetical protein
MKTFLQRLDLSLYLRASWDSFFESRHERQNVIVRNLFLIVLYLVGIYLWGKMFSWGREPLDFFDWAIINIPRLDFMRDALQTGVPPLHMADTAPLHDISDRFFTLPM